jgi:hypothetical protein
MSEHIAYIREQIAQMRPLSEAEKSTLRRLLAPAIAAVAEQKRQALVAVAEQRAA